MSKVLDGFTQVEVATTDTRQFVDTLLRLGKIGGALTKECPAFKGVVLRARVILLDEDVPKIPQSAIIRVIPKEGSPQKPKATRGRKPAEKKEAVVEDAPKEGVSEE